MEIAYKDIVLRDYRESDIADDIRWMNVDIEWIRADTPWAPIEKVDAEELRADMKEYINTLPEDAIRYQQGCSRISGGELYAVDCPSGRGILCAEGMENGTLLVKELLGQPSACEEIARNLHATLPGFSGSCRFPGTDVPFGMLKWLENSRADVWNWDNFAYLGLAFD